jgi:maleate isomerase
MRSAVRARIGFTSVAFVTEIVPKFFYEMVPDGVLLSLLTVELKKPSLEEMKRIHQETLSHVRSFARAGCNVIFLGGAPTNLANGWDYLRRTLVDLENELKVPVTSNATAQHRALTLLGAKNIGIVNPYGRHRANQHHRYMQEIGLSPVGEAFAESAVEDYHLIPAHKAYDLGVALKREHPEIDTLYFSCPHWNSVDAIEPLEKELGINVVASLQVLVWEGLRLAGIDDRIAGYGKLLQQN